MGLQKNSLQGTEGKIISISKDDVFLVEWCDGTLCSKMESQLRESIRIKRNEKIDELLKW